jgi:hypothetical protein
MAETNEYQDSSCHRCKRCRQSLQITSTVGSTATLIGVHEEVLPVWIQEKIEEVSCNMVFIFVAFLQNCLVVVRMEKSQA